MNKNRPDAPLSKGPTSSKSSKGSSPTAGLPFTPDGRPANQGPSGPPFTPPNRSQADTTDGPSSPVFDVTAQHRNASPGTVEQRIGNSTSIPKGGTTPPATAPSYRAGAGSVGNGRLPFRVKR